MDRATVATRVVADQLCARKRVKGVTRADAAPLATGGGSRPGSEPDSESAGRRKHQAGFGSERCGGQEWAADVGGHHHRPDRCGAVGGSGAGAVAAQKSQTGTGAGRPSALDASVFTAAVLAATAVFGTAAGVRRAANRQPNARFS